MEYNFNLGCFEIAARQNGFALHRCAVLSSSVRSERARAPSRSCWIPTNEHGGLTTHQVKVKHFRQKQLAKERAAYLLWLDPLRFECGLCRFLAERGIRAPDSNG